jgi:hypothetical protein
MQTLMCVMEDCAGLLADIPRPVLLIHEYGVSITTFEGAMQRLTELRTQRTLLRSALKRTT